MTTDSSLDTCGSCAGITAETPVSVVNPPGLSALNWRVGTQARFKQSLLAAVSADPTLRPLTARTDDDPSIALLDAWATALDVLTFYQERIANENYLRTATELTSIVQLARAIGYELRPGVSASTLLAFNLETQTVPGAVAAATIPASSKIQSIPGQNEKPQIFETSADLVARATWNAMPARTRGSSVPFWQQTVLYLQGVASSLQPGDGLLIVGDERVQTAGNENWDFRRVLSVALNVSPTPNQSFTAVTLDRPLGAVSPHTEPAKTNPRVFALRRRASLFGANAPDPRIMDAKTAANFGVTGSGASFQWANFNTSYSSAISDTTIYLDGAQPAAVQGAWIVLVAGIYEEVYQISKVAESAQAQFGLAGKATQLTLTGENLAAVYGKKLRETSVFIQTDELALAAAPITADLVATSTELELATLLTGDDVLPLGRPLIVSDGVSTEPVTLQSTQLSADGTATVLVFNEHLVNTYSRASVKVLGNVVAATNGETRLLPSPGMLPLPGLSFATAGIFGPPRSEILGSGDGTQTFQKFVLKQSPLTYVSAATASGGSSTLQIRINDVLWTEVPSLYGHGPNENIYITRIASDGSVMVEFGDGITGARLPTGAENVAALYRVGTGLAGDVRAGQLSLILTPTLGVKNVANPLPATGGSDGEQWDQARQNAPLTVLTLDRVVSLLDCENFARAFSGIGKAAASLIWDGEFQTVHLTVAGADGGAVDPSSALYQNLVDALDAARHPQRPIIVETFSAKPFQLEAKVVVDPAYDQKEIFAELTAALATEFSFENRDFAQAVTSSDLYAAAQRIPGVVAIDLSKLCFVGDAPSLRTRLPARSAWLDTSGVHSAELLTLDVAAITLNSMST